MCSILNCAVASVGRQSKVGWRGRRESALCQSRRVSGDLSEARGESQGRRPGEEGWGLVAVGQVSSQLRAQSETVLVLTIAMHSDLD